MRLSQKYIQTIKEAFNNVFKEGEVYLFGSRVDDSKKGGDIDLYLVIKDKTDLLRKKIKFLAKIKRALGEQKIDVVFNQDSNRLIEQEARQWGIKL